MKLHKLLLLVYLAGLGQMFAAQGPRLLKPMCLSYDIAAKIEHISAPSPEKIAQARQAGKDLFLIKGSNSFEVYTWIALKKPPIGEFLIHVLCSQDAQVKAGTTGQMQEKAAMHKAASDLLADEEDREWSVEERESTIKKYTPRYEPADANNLTLDDVVCLIDAGLFSYDQDEKYLAQLEDVKFNGDFSIDCIFCACSKLEYYYTHKGKHDLAGKAWTLKRKYEKMNILNMYDLT